MEGSKLKNIVILKNLPSNLVEEAIVVLKSNKKVKKLEKVEKNKIIENEIEIKKDKDYVLKEAEMLVSNYVAKLENQNDTKRKNIEVSKKYKRLKQYAYISSFIIFLQALLLMG